MVAVFPEISRPELFFGFVAPIGTDVPACIDDFKINLIRLGYKVVEIKVTDLFIPLSRFIKPTVKLAHNPEAERYTSFISYGNQLRKEFSDDSVLAAMTIARLIRKRTKPPTSSGEHHFSKTAFLIHQFKRKEEIDLFRSVYGRQFFQISVYSRRGARVDFLSHRFANTSNSANMDNFRSKAEDVIQIDQNEHGNSHGQKVLKIFHDADFIINLDAQIPARGDQIKRFCDLVFGSNRISPTKSEYGMFVAKAAALRTLDLSRQVGAAIFSEDGEVITMGANEVPKGGGGTYWCDDDVDDREYVRKHDSNDRRKSEILSEIFELIKFKAKNGAELVEDSQFMDALEYGRIVHAEMSAIVDAARLGRSVNGGTLFCTTFPCHMCAKHIVAAGLKKVVFLEPYPKSLVLDLHSDSIVVEGNDRGKFGSFPSAQFEHFCGVAPRRYRELFERGKRKEGGKFVDWANGEPRPSLNIRSPYYHDAEKFLIKSVIPEYIKKINFDINLLK